MTTTGGGPTRHPAGGRDPPGDRYSFHLLRYTTFSMSGALALVGATGGAGTTRTALECAAVLADDGRDVTVLDAAYATQGLADHLERRIDPDVTALCVDDRPLEEGLMALDWPVDGDVAVCPARAPFERIARAKTVEAAKAFERLVERARRDADHVLLDVPPVAANQAVAAVNAADRVGLVAPDTDRGAAAAARMRDRITDLGADVDGVVATRGPGDRLGAVASLPAVEGQLPAALEDANVAAGCAAAANALLDVEIDVEEGSLLDVL